MTDAPTGGRARVAAAHAARSTAARRRREMKAGLQLAAAGWGILSPQHLAEGWKILEPTEAEEWHRFRRRQAARQARTATTEETP